MLSARLLSAQRRLKSLAVTSPGNLVHSFKEMPTPKGLPFIGTTLELIRSGSTPKLHEYVDRRHKELGRIYREKLGNVDCVFVADPEETRNVFALEGKFPMHVLPEAWIFYNKIYGCKRGLFFMDGEKWWYHRKIMNKILLKGDLSWIDAACDAATDNLINTLKSIEYPAKIEEVLYKSSLDVLVAVLLGNNNYKKYNKEIDDQLNNLAKTVNLVFNTTAKLTLIPANFASKFKIRPWKDFVKSVDDALYLANYLHQTLSKIVNNNNNSNNSNNNNDGLLSKLLQEDIENEEISRIIADLILAAGDTTAYAMEWLLYLISKNPQTQTELRENPQLSRYYLRETLRLYPVAPFLTRILPEDSIVCGFEIPKNTLIVLSIYTTGRDPRYFSDPLKFWPRRWHREFNEGYKSEMQKASLPFAMGLRSCIGRKIAETQLRMTAEKIVNRFDVKVDGSEEVDAILKMVMVPDRDIKFIFDAI